MEPTTDSAPAVHPARLLHPHAELIVLNGRQSGTARPLDSPLTLIGRAVECDVRLNVDGIGPVQCVVAALPFGLALRAMPGSSATLVNDRPVLACDLRDGDRLTVGPFQFGVRLQPLPLAASPESTDREKQALRIQAAAVVAQQAALTEEEIRLEQRRSSLEQQEQQLASHLDERQQRLEALRQEALAARLNLHKERAAYEQRVADVLADLAAARRELADQQAAVQAERQRLLDLRKRLKRRWHRQWASERAAMQKREAQVARRLQELEKETDLLVQAGLRSNGEFELGRQRLREEFDLLHKQQEELRERALSVERREAELQERENGLADASARNDETRRALEQEAEGLEARIRNYRHKVQDHEQEVKRLASLLASLRAQSTTEPGPALAKEDPPANQTAAIPETVVADWRQRESGLSQDEATVQARLAALDQLAGELADQRLCLAEECHRLARVQDQWQQDHDAAVGQLEAEALHLQQKEQEFQAREQALQSAESGLKHRAQDIAQLRNYLEGWRARLAAGAALWESERGSLLADLRGREDLVEQRQAALAALRERWDQRRRRQIEWLRSQRRSWQELHQDCAKVRDEWLGRASSLHQQERALAERALALEQYRQQCLAQGPDPAAAEKRLEALRRQWASLSASSERTRAKDRRLVEMEAARLEQRARELQQYADEVARREAEFASRQAAWEQEQVVVAGEHAKVKHELIALSCQRDHLEKQSEKLREEVERLARLLLDDGENAILPSAHAA